METKIFTDNDHFNRLYPLVKKFLQNDVSEFVLDGKKIRGYRSPDSKPVWIRDHTYQMKGFKYFEKDVKSALEHFLETQSDNGRIFDFFKIGEKEDWAEYVRVPAESDVEFLAVICAYQVWQTTGDDTWIKKYLKKLEKALEYLITHPWRWSKKYNLIKRPYTIDTWDFYIYEKADWLKFQVEKNTKFCIFFGDNSGFYEASVKLASLFKYFKNYRKYSYWKKLASDIRKRANKLCWNGSFYTHMIPEDRNYNPASINMAEQLSLSNTYSINRGFASECQAGKIIDEYIKRKERTESFAEWFSIDPPFPAGIFKDSKLNGGAYINGGIMPFVGGELAKASFDNGYEKYGSDILKRYISLISEKEESYLWYFPDGRPGKEEDSTSPDALPTDGWGSSAMLYAFIEGLAGIEQNSKLFDYVRLIPKFSSAGINEAECTVCFPSSGKYFKYSYSKNSQNRHILIKIESEKSDIDLCVLLPENHKDESVKLNGNDILFKYIKKLNSLYINTSFKMTGKSEVIVSY